jgi:hypothetical protein
MGTKISGLPAVAAFTDTQEYAVNDGGTTRKITGAQLAAHFPLGTVAQAPPVTANQGGITTVTDLTGLTVTFTTIVGRRYEVIGFVSGILSSVANDNGALVLADGSNNQLQTANVICPSSFGAFALVKFEHVPGAGSRIYKLRAVRLGGTGTLTVAMSTTAPGLLWLKDIGI